MSLCSILLVCLTSHGSTLAPLHSAPLEPPPPTGCAPCLLLVCVCIRLWICIRHPCFRFLPVDPLLIPPPPRHPRPPYLVGPLTEAQKRSRCNVLRDRVLPVIYWLPHVLKPCFLHGPLQGGVKQLPVPPPPWLSPRDPSRGPMHSIMLAVAFVWFLLIFSTYCRFFLSWWPWNNGLWYGVDRPLTEQLGGCQEVDNGGSGCGVW